MKNSPQGFARSVMLTSVTSVDKCMNVERQERKKKDFRFLRKPFLKYKLDAATHTGPRYIICHREIIFCLNRFPETKPAYQNEHTEPFVGMFVGAVLTGKKIFWSSTQVSSSSFTWTLKLLSWISLNCFIFTVRQNIRIWPPCSVLFIVTAIALVIVRKLRGDDDVDVPGVPDADAGPEAEFLHLESGDGHSRLVTTSEETRERTVISYGSETSDEVAMAEVSTSYNGDHGGVTSYSEAGQPPPWGHHGPGPGPRETYATLLQTQGHHSPRVKLNPLFHQYQAKMWLPSQSVFCMLNRMWRINLPYHRPWVSFNCQFSTRQSIYFKLWIFYFVADYNIAL